MEKKNFFRKIEEAKDLSRDIEADVVTDILMMFMQELLGNVINKQIDKIKAKSSKLSFDDIADDTFVETIRVISSSDKKAAEVIGTSIFVNEAYYKTFLNIIESLNGIVMNCDIHKYKNESVIKMGTSLSKITNLYYLYDPRRYGGEDVAPRDFEEKLNWLGNIYDDKLYGDTYYDKFIGKLLPSIIESNISRIQPHNYMHTHIVSEKFVVVEKSVYDSSELIKKQEKDIFYFVVDDAVYDEFITMLKKRFEDDLWGDVVGYSAALKGYVFRFNITLDDLVKEYYMELRRLEYYRGIEDDKAKEKVKK